MLQGSSAQPSNQVMFMKVYLGISLLDEFGNGLELDVTGSLVNGSNLAVTEVLI